MYYFIINEHGASGKGAVTWALIKLILEERKIEYKSFVSQGKGNATEIANEICAMRDSDKKIIVVGGDGTVNEVINGITDFKNVSFGLVPTGSGNDFARGMKIPKGVIHAMEKILKSKGDKVMDIGQIHCEGSQPRLFGISAGAGLDALVCKKVDSSLLKKVLNKIHLGGLSYIILTVINLFSMKTFASTVVFDDEYPVEYRKLIFFAGMNVPTEGGGVRMAPKASVYDGKLSCCMAHGIPKFLTFTKLPLLSAGKHSKLKGFLLKDFERVQIISDKVMVTHADGEFAGESNKIEIICKKNTLRILI